MADNFRYQDSLWPKTDAKEIVFNEIVANSSVLDLGCWTGRLGEKLKKEKGCYIAGVDIDKTALRIAAGRLDFVYRVDLDFPGSVKKKIQRKFDYIVLTDVLEHLKEPEKLLKMTKRFLAKDGLLIASVPNVANWSVRLSLLIGRFDYEETGILDKTHLRFFTQKTARKMFDTSGYTIEKIKFSGTTIFPTLKAVQFVLFCRTGLLRQATPDSQ